MEYTKLGKTGLEISRMGFGGIPIQKVDVPAVRALMERMAEKGVNYIDTARGYTVSEAYIGEALEGMRDKFVLATKSMARTREARELIAAGISTNSLPSILKSIELMPVLSVVYPFDLAYSLALSNKSCNLCSNLNTPLSLKPEHSSSRDK